MGSVNKFIMQNSFLVAYRCDLGMVYMAAGRMAARISFDPKRMMNLDQRFYDRGRFL